MRVTVVHLASGSLGVSLLRDFVGSYRRFSAGRDHDLVVVLNGVADSEREVFDDALLPIGGGTVLSLQPLVVDLAAYRVVVQAISSDVFAFLNARSTVRCDEWLSCLTDPLQDPEVGMVAATGSWESPRMPRRPPLPSGSAKGRLLAAIKRELDVLRRRRAFQAFPNPHLRTNAFAMRREVIETLQWPLALSRNQALRLESGRGGLTAQVTALGLRPLVADRFGGMHDAPAWPWAKTYRSADQEHLLVADRRTDEYAEADPQQRLRLRTLAFGAVEARGPQR